MDTRKVKLALTVGLINKCSQCNPILAVRDVMAATKEAGHFIKSSLISKQALNNEHIGALYSVEFENCTLSIDVVLNRITKNRYVNRFEIS